MNFTDGLQELPLIPRSHFHHSSTSRVAPKRSFCKRGLQSPGSRHVKILHPAATAQSALSTVTGRAAARHEQWRGPGPTPQTSPTWKEQHPVRSLQNHTMGLRLSSISARSLFHVALVGPQYSCRDYSIAVGLLLLIGSK